MSKIFFFSFMSVFDIGIYMVAKWNGKCKRKGIVNVPSAVNFFVGFTIRTLHICRKSVCGRHKSYKSNDIEIIFSVYILLYRLFFCNFFFPFSIQLWRFIVTDVDLQKHSTNSYMDKDIHIRAAQKAI